MADTQTRMPVLFIGHGSPMNAITTNRFSETLGSLGRKIPRPRAILCVSAHWMTDGTWVTHMPKPKTIHDFHGFPQALFDVKYPASGSPEIAEEIQAEVKEPKIHLDDELWGLDHGTWSVLRHLYPKADVPVLQLSVYMEQPPEYHFELGKRLRRLRDRGILIIGSGNIVHNLRTIRWEEDAPSYDWAIEFDEWVKDRLLQKDHAALVTDVSRTKAGKLSVPAPDHWYPFLYVLGVSDEKDELSFDYEGLENGSISMRSVRFR